MPNTARLRRLTTPPPPTVINTRDIGLAIRDHLDEHRVHHFTEMYGTLTEDNGGEIIGFEHVDVSDPDNLVITLSNGQAFVVRIFAKGA